MYYKLSQDISKWDDQSLIERLINLVENIPHLLLDSKKEKNYKDMEKIKQEILKRMEGNLK